jgi:hypothetical protein
VHLRGAFLDCWTLVPVNLWSLEEDTIIVLTDGEERLALSGSATRCDDASPVRSRCDRNIAHPNLDSVNQIARKTGDQAYEISVGGSLDDMGTLMRAVFASLCHTLHDSSAICLAVFDPQLLERTGQKWSTLVTRVYEATRARDTEA